MAERRVTIAMILRDLFSKQATKIGKSIGQLNEATSDLRKELGPLGSALSVFGAIVAGRKISNLSSQVEELNSRFRIVFGTVESAAQVFAEDLGDSIGRSTNRIKGFLAALQDTFVPLGFTREAAFDLSSTLTQLALDVASFTDKSDADVLRDFQSAIVGNGETVRKYGIVVLESAIKQEAFNQGLDPKKLTEQQKVLIRTSIILKQTSDAQGDAARTSGSFANQSKQLDDNLADLGVAAGDILNNFMLPFIQALNQVLPLLSNFVESNQTLLTIFLSLSAVVLGVIAAIKGYVVAVLLAKVATAAFGVVAQTTFAGPILLRSIIALRVGVLALGGAVGFLKNALIALLVPLGKFALIGTAIAFGFTLVVAVIRRLTGEYDSLGEAVAGTFSDIASAFDAIFNSALQIEDLVLILEATFEKVLARIKNLFFNPIKDLFVGLKDAGNAQIQLLGNFIKLTFEKSVLSVKKFLNEMIIEISIAVGKAVAELTKLAARAGRAFPEIDIGLPTLDTKQNEEAIGKIEKRIDELRSKIGKAGTDIKNAVNVDLALANTAEEEAAIEARLQAAIASNIQKNADARLAAEKKVADEKKKNIDAQKAAADAKIQKELDAENEKINKQLELQRIRQEQDASAQSQVDKFVASQDKAISKIKQINQQIEGGIIFADAGASQRDKLAAEREAEFQQALTNLEALKAAAADEGQATFIDRLIADLKEANEKELPETISRIDQLRVTAANAASGPLTDMFESLINGSKSAKDAFKDFALGFIKNIVRMIAQMLALRAIALVTGVPVGAAGGFSLGANEGGLIPGRGPNVDSVPATLTRGEFVVRRSAVDKYGAGFMSALNQGAISKSALAGMHSAENTRNTSGRFAQGGTVSSSSAPASNAGGREFTPVFVSNDNNVQQMLDGGPAGFMRFAEKNRTEIRAILDMDS